MDGQPNPKNKQWHGKDYSETQFATIQWLERELPGITGNVLHVSACNWDVPKILLTNPGVESYKTFDKKSHGKADFFGDVHDMPADWTEKWDCVICSNAIGCYENPFKAIEELRRILKRGGVLLVDAPFNYRWFGSGSWDDIKQNKQDVKDYWRITRQGWELLLKKFKSFKIERTGPNKYDPYGYMTKAIK